MSRSEPPRPRHWGMKGDVKQSQEPLLAAAKDKDPQVRAAVIEALAGMKSPKIEEIFISALKDEDPNVRLSAARGTGGDQVSQGHQTLVSRLER